MTIKRKQRRPLTTIATGSLALGPTDRRNTRNAQTLSSDDVVETPLRVNRRTGRITLDVEEVKRLLGLALVDALPESSSASEAASGDISMNLIWMGW